MRIWWCQEHEASSDGSETWNCLRDGYGPCRLVPMRLIPDNAETPDEDVGPIPGAKRRRLVVPLPRAFDGETP